MGKPGCLDPHDIARRLGGKVCDPPPRLAQLAAPYVQKEDKVEYQSSMFCEHANECPSLCRCPPDCACREIMCRNKGGEMLIKYGPALPVRGVSEAIEALDEMALRKAVRNMHPTQSDKPGQAWNDVMAGRRLSFDETNEFRSWCREKGMDLDRPDRRHLEAELLVWLLTRKATPFDYLVLAAGKAWVWWKGLWE
jgi:hypothetical protein